MNCPRCQHTNGPHQLLCSCCQQILFHAKLRVVEPHGAEKHFKLTYHDFTIGRQAGNDLVLADEAASRCHARLRFVKGAYLAEDLQSKNGLYINGEKVASKPLATFDCLQIGATRIYYVLSTNSDYPVASVPASSSTSKTVTPIGACASASPSSDAESLLENVLRHTLRGALSLAQAQRATLWMPEASGDLIPRVSAHGSEIISNAHNSTVAWPAEVVRQEQLALKIFHSGAMILREQWEGTEIFWEGMAESPDFVYQQIGFSLRQANDAAEASEAFASRPPLGALILECAAMPQRFSAAKLARLQSLLTQSARFVGNAQLIATSLQEFSSHTTQQLSETALAMTMQKRLLPLTIPKIAGYDLACWHRPSEAVSGDYLDLIPINTNELLLVVGDVAGKGLAAAMLINAMQASLHLQLYYESRLEEFVVALNRVVNAVGKRSVFATLFLGVLNPQRRMLHYINAGHTPGLFIHSSDATPQIELLHSTGAALGVLESLHVEVKQLLLPPASALVFFTDGLTEAANENGEQYGLTRLTERVVATVMSSRSPSAASVLEALRDDLAFHSADFHGKIRHHDDQAALAVMVR